MGVYYGLLSPQHLRFYNSKFTKPLEGPKDTGGPLVGNTYSRSKKKGSLYSKQYFRAEHILTPSKKLSKKLSNPLKRYGQWKHLFKILFKIEPFYEYYRNFYHAICEVKIQGGPY